MSKKSLRVFALLWAAVMIAVLSSMATMLVSGLSMFLTGPTLGGLVRKLDARIPMFVGFSMAAWGFWLGHDLTENWGFWEFAA